jgi:hypothetical protein
VFDCDIQYCNDAVQCQQLNENTAELMGNNKGYAIVSVVESYFANNDQSGMQLANGNPPGESECGEVWVSGIESDYDNKALIITS